MTRALLSAILCLASAACGGETARRNLSYGDNAREAYQAAMEDFRDEDCLNAEPAFRGVRRRFPYSRFSALAELRVADCLMMGHKFPQAIGAYRRFVRNRPSHEGVPYARFKVAVAYFKQIPDDWLLAPPAEERDQGPTRDALRQLRRFIMDFPDDERVEPANELAAQALTLLARHELYVANFYLDRDHPEPAIARLRLLLSSYPGSGVEAEAQLLLGSALLDEGDRAHAREVLQELVGAHSDSEYAAQARRLLAGLGG